MKRFITLIITVLLSISLSGCYLDDINDQEYGTVTEEELLRHGIWEAYYEHEETYLDKNLYDIDNIDWIEVLSQNPSFRRLLEEMGEYSFLIEVYENKQQYLHRGYYRIQLHYNDLSTGYGTAYEIPILDYAETYDELYYETVTLEIDGKTFLFETTSSNTVKMTYDANVTYQTIHSNIYTFPLDTDTLTIKKVPLGYELELNGTIVFVYDMKIFDK
jgi:hypothetical protein